MSRTLSPPVQHLCGLFVGINNRPSAREPSVSLTQAISAAAALGALAVAVALICGAAS